MTVSQFILAATSGHTVLMEKVQEGFPVQLNSIWSFGVVGTAWGISTRPGEKFL